MPEEAKTEPSAPDVPASKPPTKEAFAEWIPGRWSSHPAALKRQRIWFFALGLVPLLALVAIGFAAFSDFRAWIDLFVHPGRAVALVALAISYFVGVAGTVAVMNLMGRACVGNRGLEKGRLEISRTIVFAGVFLFLLPLAATWLPNVRGHGSLVFVLSLLCFVPLGAILLLVLFGGRTEPRPATILRRRRFWLSSEPFSRRSACCLC